MPDTGTSATAEAEPKEGNAEPDTGTPSEPFAKTKTSTYKTEADVVKALGSAQSELQRVQTELAEAKRREQESGVMAKLADAVGKLGADKPDTKAQEEWAATMREQIAEDPGKAFDLMQDSLAAVDRDYAKRAADIEGKLRQEFQDEINRERSERAEQTRRSNPVYQQHQDKVEEAMQKYNVTEDVALKIVADTVALAPPVDPPPGTTGTWTAAGDPKPKSKVNSGTLERLRAAYPDLTDVELKALGA